MFPDGPVEGVYMKIEEGGVVRQRSKVVRANVIAGGDHWTKGIIKENKILDEHCDTVLDDDIVESDSAT
jgi:atypical dual specificity phosphatase